MKFVAVKIALLIAIIVGASVPSMAYVNEGTLTYNDYLFVLVHGVHSRAGMWDGTLDDEKYRNMFGNLKQFLDNDLGLKGRVYYYTFSNPDGSNIVNAKELADRANPNNWLSRAQEDYKKWVVDRNPSDQYRKPDDVPASLIPSRFIIITHSMGNMSVRSYIYSDYLSKRGLFEKGFYNDDVAKVVFIAPPFLGTEAAFMSAYKFKLAYDELMKIKPTCDFLAEFISNVGMAGDAKFVYNLAKTYASYRIYNDELWESMKSAVMDKQGNVRLDINMDSTSIWDEAAWELMPVAREAGDLNINKLGYYLEDAKLDDPTKEPSYSIVYGRGVPVPNFLGSALGHVELATLNGLKDKVASESVARRFMDETMSYFNDFSLTLMPNSGFWQMPTRQGQFMSLLMANRYLVMSNDGDFFVPTWSAKGEGVAHLKNLSPERYHEHIFKSDGFESYLSGQFEEEVAAATTVYYTSQFFGTPKWIAAFVYWSCAVSLYSQTERYLPEIKDSLHAHGSIVKRYDLIRDAILDDPAIFTVTDLQTTLEATTTEEGAALVFSVSSPEAGYHSIKARGIEENRAYRGLTSMSIPATINNDRKYLTTVSLTKAPDRIVGKLNYLVPKLMKSFEYSFNFAAWKPIEGVDPETGEFVIDGLPFAEGQNVLAIRAENAVGIKSHQLLKIVLNAIPLLPSKFEPMSGQYISQSDPTISVEFNKSEYTGDYESEKITIKEMMIDGITVEAQTESTMESYHPWAKASYKASALSEGEHTVVVRAESNVGVSQGIWSFYVDRSPPTISIEAIAPYSPRAPTTIRYTASDEVSPHLLAVRCDLYSTNNLQPTTDNFIANIATAESLSKGENFFVFDPSKLSAHIPDGNYKVKIKAFDLAGNHAIAEQPITVDSTPPTVLGVDVSPNPMTSKTSEMGLAARVDEQSTIIIKLNNLSNNTVTAYLAQSSVVASESLVGSYSWKYDQTFSKGPEDGVYRIEVIARDEAGNESRPTTLEGIRISRIPPEIYGQTAVPYVLSNIGANAYKTTLSYNLKEAVSVKIKIYNANTGKLVETIENAPASTTGENRVVWNGSAQPKGAYKLQIVAEDNVGNIGTAYASCVKDGIAPEITYPAEDGAAVSGTIAIRGTAIDPDWTNDKPFKRYSVHYKKAGGEWRADFIEVPPANRDPQDPKNISIRPLQNSSTLAYLYTNNLENGEYLVRVIADEDGGESLVAERKIVVGNDSFGGGEGAGPYTKLNPLPKAIEFMLDDSVKLPISFINSVKPANVYVEILEPRRLFAGSTFEAVVFSQYLPNISGAPFTGKPDYQPGRDLGYFFWLDETGYHLRWSADSSSHKFSGTILAVGGEIAPIMWNDSLAGREGGVDFAAKSGQLMISAKIDEDPASPSIYADRVYLGASKYSQQYLPIIIDVASQSLIDASSMGGAVSDPSKTKPPQEVSWNGKYDTGGFVDDGTYIVRVRGEGVDGRGISTDEAIVNVKTPFKFALEGVSNKEFSTLGAPDRVSVSYKVNKDSIINAVVYDDSGNFVSRLADGAEVPGSNYAGNLFWRGNFPAADSSQIKNGGRYKIVLNVSAKDGSGSRQETIDGISISSFLADNSVKLAPIGDEVRLNGETIRLAKGESPFFLEAKATGKYYPPRDFAFTLSATGEQNLTAYPFVPFAGLLHRGFREVKTKVKVKYRIHCWNWELGADDEWHAFGVSGRWWNPWKWGMRYYDLEEERWAEEGLVLKQGDEAKSIPFDFRTDVWWHQGTADLTAGKPSPGSGIYSIEAFVDVYAKDGSFTLDSNSVWVATGADKIPTLKGIFSVSSNGSEYEFARDEKNYGGFKGELVLQLASPIAYSRLTNRFVPWVGFVSNKQKQTQDFSEYLGDINRGLGFPGKAFFMDPEAKPDKPYLSTAEMTARLTGMNWHDRAAEIGRMANEASLLGYKDALGSTAGYDDYLADEYFEFIPITSPDQHNNKPGGFTWTNNSPIVTASTDLVYPADGANGLKPVFSLPWPWVETEYSAIEGNEAKKRTDFTKNPQRYSATSKDGTFWEFDIAELNQRRAETAASRIIAGRTVFNKLENESNWTTTESYSQLLPVPNYVNNPRYLAASDDPSLKIFPNKVVDLSAPLDWSTEDDLNLVPTNKQVASGPLIFNDGLFSSKKQVRLAEIYPLNKSDCRSINAQKYTFLVNDPFDRCPDSPLDNPNIVLSGWSVNVKDKAGLVNRDIDVKEVEMAADRGTQAHWKNDAVDLKLKLDAAEASYLEIIGEAPGPYELSYFDGQSWKNIVTTYENKPTVGRLGWWNVGRLNGKYTLLLRSNGFIATQDISVGTIVGDSCSGEACSTYRRAQLKFPAGAFGIDQLVTITPVSMSEIYIRNRPIIITSGPIVEIKPSPWKFALDQRPTLKFVYTFDELKELKAWNGIGTPEGIPWNIHQVTANGDLQIIGGNRQEIENNNGEMQYAFYAPLDHFSTYALLPGKLSLSAPVVFADRYITNKNSVTIYGTAEPDSILSVYISEEPRNSFAGSEPKATAEASADGAFHFENIPLLQEGNNYIYVTSHPAGNEEIMTWSDVTIIKDTIPPSAEASANLYVFSPNGDGKHDTVDYTIKSNERGKIHLQLTTNDLQLLNVELSAEAEKEQKISWDGDKLSDGEYRWTVYAIDEAGNVSNNVTGQTVLDTTPPSIISLIADPNPFTPNNDGVKDETTFSYQLSEPAYVNLNIHRDDGQLFRSYEGPTANFFYPTTQPPINLTPQASAGDWSWNGLGSKNELLGGTYSYSIIAEDNVGNKVSSEAKTVTVDRAPTLIPFAFAEPDPFAPVNPKNNFTEIKYYLARDNLVVRIWVVGQEGKEIKLLAGNEVQGKGDHSLRWYGDFDSNYSGPTASADKYRVADGSYEFKILAEDPSEAGAASAEVSNTVLVDNVPPQILIKDLQVDYSKNTAKLYYSIPENSSIEAAVYNKNGELLATLVSGETLAAGDHELDYSFLVSGESYFQIVATDQAQNQAEKKSSFFSLDANALRVGNASANPATFTPNGDGFTDLTRLSYQIAGGEGPYQVNLNIIGQGGVTVRRLLENEEQSAGIYSFYWDGFNDSRQTVVDGYYEAKIVAIDKQGALAESNIPLLVVSTRPSVELSIAGSSPEAITFNYSVNYPVFYITGEALVKLEVLNPSSEAVWSKIFNQSAGSYGYLWDGSSLVPGQYYARASAQDALGSLAVPVTTELLISAETVTIPDPPTEEGHSSLEVSGIIIDPSLAGFGQQVHIKFLISEQLKLSPKVYVTQNGAPPLLAPVSGAWNLGSSECLARYDVIPGFDGPALITIEAIDLAGNLFVYSLDNSLIVDASAPAISSLASFVDNPEFDKEARAGSVATISFTVSEPLKFNPEVKVNDGTAAFSRRLPGLTEEAYEYTYIVSSSDENGNAKILISGYDLAGNFGTYETTSSEESFVIDLENPSVVIAPPESDLIANPSPFSTNSDPAESRRQTYLTYAISEAGQVTVKVHKVPDNKPADQLARGDFRADNFINTIVSGRWDSAGTYREMWDGSIAAGGLAPPGKYAFLVEVHDRAGNLAQRLWGGTVWIQDNVLRLKGPEQREVEELHLNNNPDPSVVSPNGNSMPEGKQKRARVYFRVDLGVTPRSCDRPERIEILSVEDDVSWEAGQVKQVGYYSLKIEDLSGNLIRLVADNKLLYSGTLIGESWDGKNSDGNFVADGIYRPVVEVKDFLGAGPAVNELTLNNVIIDNTPPTLTNVSAAPYFFSPGNTTSIIKTTTLTYEVADNSGQASVTAAVEGLVNLVSSEAKTNGQYSVVWDGNAAANDGIYLLKISAVDTAGNTVEAGPVEVFIDRIEPVVGQPATISPTNEARPTWSWPAASDPAPLSGVTGYFVSVDGGADVWLGTAESFRPASAYPEGIYNLRLRAKDAAGNISNYEPAAPVTIDLSAPSSTIAALPQYSTAASFAVVWSGTDAGNPASGIKNFDVQYKIGSGAWQDWQLNTTATQGIFSGSDGQTYSFRVRARDLAGNVENYPAAADATTRIDASPPVSAVTALPAWKTTTSFTVSWSGADTVSGVKDYDVQYKDGGGAWTNWLANTTAVSATFNGTEGHTYCFQCRARDNAGNIESYPGGNGDTSTRIDATSPTLVINSVSPNPFNPMLGNAEITWTISENISNVKSEVYVGTADFARIKTVRSFSDGFVPPGECSYVWDGRNDNGDFVNEGDYLLWATVMDEAGNGIGYGVGINIRDNQFITVDGRMPHIEIEQSENYMKIKWNTPVSSFEGFERGCRPDYARNIVDPGQYIQGFIGGLNDPWQPGINIATFEGVTHKVWGSSRNIYYQRDSSPSVIIASPTMSDHSFCNPSITVEVSGHAYVAWQMNDVAALDRPSVYFQKIPSNFAPVTGSRMGAMSIVKVAAASSLEAPILISPANDKQNVSSLRPTFEWEHLAGGASSYQLDLAKNDSFSIDHRTFSRSSNTGSDGHFSFAIHEFDPGLDHDTYYWMVTALATNEAATSEVWSFKIEPMLTLTEVTNYPNPFSPNRERTKIRYRLGADADSVKIRIYDIVGGLVTELDGTTDGEQSSIWQKYNDVEWDGRNGRGDLVVNGIYPFEIIARLGDRSISGRGKIAVLK